MNKWIAMVLMVLLTSGCATFGLENINLPKQVAQYYEQNTWQISNNRYFGTAFYISPTLLITNAHVVSDGLKDRHGRPPEEFFLTRQGRLSNMPVEIVRMDKDLDLALLRCVKCPELGPIVPYILHSDTYPQGTRAFGGGNGLGLFSIHTGFIQTSDSRYVYSDVVKAPGDSGSPLIVLRNGNIHIVGVRSAVANAFGAPVYHKGRSIRMSVVKKWLSQ